MSANEDLTTSFAIKEKVKTLLNKYGPDLPVERITEFFNELYTRNLHVEYVSIDHILKDEDDEDSEVLSLDYTITGNNCTIHGSWSDDPEYEYMHIYIDDENENDVLIEAYKTKYGSNAMPKLVEHLAQTMFHKSASFLEQQPQ